MKKYIYILLMLSVSIIGYGQRVESYNMYNLYQPLINPAAMGGYNQFTTAGIFNTQMVGFDGAPINFGVDVTAPIGKSNAIIGGQVLHNRIGARNTTRISASFAYRIPINLRNYLCFGLTGTVQLLNADFAGLTQADPNDPLAWGQSYQIWSPDFRFGAYYFRDKFYAGVSVNNLISVSYDQPNVRINKDEIHFNVHTGYDFTLSPSFHLQPSLLWKQVSGSSTQLDVNLQLKYKGILGVGISYRTTNTMVFQANVKFAKRFTLGYSFNMGLGISNRTEYTGHEVLFIYQGLLSKRNVSVQTPHY